MIIQQNVNHDNKSIYKNRFQVNRAGQEEVDQPTPTSFKSSQISMRQVTKKSISSSSRKVSLCKKIYLMLVVLKISSFSQKLGVFFHVYIGK